MTKIPKPPRYVISKIIKLHKKLAEDTLLEHHGYSYSGPAFEEFVNAVHTAIPKADRKALYNSLVPLAGIDLLDKEIDELAWRLAGNVHNLSKGIAVPFWTRQLFPEWAPVQIISVKRYLAKVKTVSGSAKTEKRACRVKLFILGGLAAGRTIERTWTDGYCQHLRTIFGFSRYDRAKYSYDDTKPNYPLLNVLEFTRLRFLAYITPEKSINEPDFEKIECPGGCLSWNKKLMKKRQRQGHICPKQYPLAVIPCYKCEQGYDKCSAACHPNTFLLRGCPACEVISYFDPANNDDVCVNCMEKKLKQYKKE